MNQSLTPGFLELTLLADIPFKEKKRQRWEVYFSTPLLESFRSYALEAKSSGRGRGEARRGMAVQSVELTVNALEDVAARLGVDIDGYAGKADTVNGTTPDMFIVYRGRRFLVEVKCSGEKVSHPPRRLLREAQVFGAYQGREGRGAVRVNGRFTHGSPLTVQVFLLEE
ncbi:hypothetical protein [Candidatus Hecatella orcuttiae]|jgi:hypothetical protein|uniref:hypothetical protein n=1 Tax=Candidatus Hecatella orcuttiae TaxID=1935119 RepID=UPI0028681C22|nr:hypothetical protein [Candidatus Hecatella orcuttiae]